MIETQIDVKTGTLTWLSSVFWISLQCRTSRNLSHKFPVVFRNDDKSIVNIEIDFPIMPFPGLIIMEKAWEIAIHPDNLSPLESPSIRDPSVTG